MKKLYIGTILFLLCSVLLVSCKCKHVWQDATCEKPQVCSKCGETQGDSLGHKWQDATCEAPQVCSRCGETQGVALGHEWRDASCNDPKTCMKCSKTEGVSNGHSFGNEWVSDESEHWHSAICEHKDLIADNETHVWDKGVILAENDCKNEGIIEYICTICGFSKKESIPAAHKWNADYSCSGCGKKLHVEMEGPAGGIIFYDCDADNATGNGDGLTSDTCGWRFLEAAPMDISKDGDETFCFGEYKEFMSGDSLYINGTTQYDPSNCTRPEIGYGYSNTKLLVETIGEYAYDGFYKTKVTDYPAKLCWEFEYNGFDDWFLPSRDELHLMYINLYKIGLGGFSSQNYWSSSESEDSLEAYFNMFSGFGWYAKGARSNWNHFRVRAVRAF